MGLLKQTALIALVSAGFLAPHASAQALPAVTVQTLTDPLVYHRDFDVLVLDFILQTAGSDALQTVTIVKTGTAREGVDYTSLKLWADEGLAGFQGWGIDKQIGTVTYQDSTWVVENTNYAFESSHRFFATIETGTAVADKIAQFALQPAFDDGDGVWEKGERGVYLKSGVTAYVPDGSYSATIKFRDGNADALPPKGYISTLPASATITEYWMIEPTTPIVFQGEARDRNGGSPTSVTLRINGTPLPATNTGTFFSTWSASYTPAASYEELTIVLEITDNTGKLWQSVPYYANVDTREASFDATTIAVSNSAIDANGKDATNVTVILNDDSFTTLPNRPITFKTLRASDKLSQTEVITDEFGRATVSLTSTQAGNAIVQVYQGEDIVGGVAVLVQEVPAEPEPQPQPQPSTLQSGDLIKGSLNAVYYYDGSKRHVFVNEAIYRSWYGTDFSKVKTISDTALAAVVLGAPVGFRPGTLVKTPSIPDVYVVDLNQTLRHVASEQVANQIFGAQWNKQIHDLSEALLFTYNFGDLIITTLHYNQQEIQSLPLTISDEL